MIRFGDLINEITFVGAALNPGLRTKSYPLFRWYLGEADGIGAAGVPVPSAGAAEFAGPGF